MPRVSLVMWVGIALVGCPGCLRLGFSHPSERGPEFGDSEDAARPTLTVVEVLTGAEEDVAFDIPYAALAVASDETSEAGEPVFVLAELRSGTLTRGDGVVGVGSRLSSNDLWTWAPEANVFGDAVEGFALRVANDAGESSEAVIVRIAVEAVNDAPSMTRIAPLLGHVASEPVDLTFAALLAASDAADVDSDVVSFRVVSIESGELTRGGNAVSAGATVGFGDELSWAPPVDASGTVTVFTLLAYDGNLMSAMSVPVQVELVPPEVRRLTGLADQGGKLVISWVPDVFAHRLAYAAGFVAPADCSTAQVNVAVGASKVVLNGLGASTAYSLRLCTVAADDSATQGVTERATTLPACDVELLPGELSTTSVVLGTVVAPPPTSDGKDSFSELEAYVAAAAQAPDVSGDTRLTICLAAGIEIENDDALGQDQLDIARSHVALVGPVDRGASIRSTRHSAVDYVSDALQNSVLSFVGVQDVLLANLTLSATGPSGRALSFDTGSSAIVLDNLAITSAGDYARAVLLDHGARATQVTNTEILATGFYGTAMKISNAPGSQVDLIRRVVMHTTDSGRVLWVNAGARIGAMREVELGSRGAGAFAIELLDGGSIGAMDDVILRRLAGAVDPAAAIRASADGGAAVYFETDSIRNVRVCSAPGARPWENNPGNNGWLVQGDESTAPNFLEPSLATPYQGTGTTGVETFPFVTPLSRGVQAGFDNVVLGGECVD